MKIVIDKIDEKLDYKKLDMLTF